MPLIGAPCWRKSANDGLLQRNGHTDRLLVIHSAVHSQGGHRDTDRRAERSGEATVTPTDARKVLVGLLAALCVLSLASPASGVGRNRPITLTGAQRRAIIRAPHPYLRQHCPARLGVLIAQRTTFGTHRVIVAEADCRYGTTGSPLDIATYARRDGRLRQLYRLYSGRSIHRSRVMISCRSPRVIDGSWSATAASPGKIPSVAPPGSTTASFICTGDASPKAGSYATADPPERLTHRSTHAHAVMRA